MSDNARDLVGHIEMLKSELQNLRNLIDLMNAGIDAVANRAEEKPAREEVLAMIKTHVPRELQCEEIPGQGDTLVRDGDGVSWGMGSSGGGTFTGVYWFKGKRYELDMNYAKAYWYHNESTGSGAWSDGPFPDPMPDMMYWRTTAECNAVEYIMC